MNMYFKYVDESDNTDCLIDVRGFNEETGIGTANYYKDGVLYAELKPFAIKDGDIEITKEEFEKLIK